MRLGRGMRVAGLVVAIGAALLASLVIQWHMYPHRQSKAARAVSMWMDRAGASLAALRRRAPDGAVPRTRG